jgi:hypothetical protein
MIFDFNGGHRNGKKVVKLALYAATIFWRFLAPQGGPLSGPGQLLTLIFQQFQSRRLVWNNKIKKFGRVSTFNLKMSKKTSGNAELPFFLYHRIGIWERCLHAKF